MAADPKIARPCHLPQFWLPRLSRSPLQVAHLCGIMRNYDSSLAELILLFPPLRARYVEAACCGCSHKTANRVKRHKKWLPIKIYGEPRWIKAESKKAEQSKMGIARDIEGERQGWGGRSNESRYATYTHTRTILKMKNHPHQTLKDCQMVQL